jgi:endonuclease
VARFNVVIPREDGGVEIYPMKEWLRRNPTHIPPGMHPTNSNSHKLRDGLRRNGWSVHEASDEIRLMPPGDDNRKCPRRGKHH